MSFFTKWKLIELLSSLNLVFETSLERILVQYIGFSNFWPRLPLELLSTFSFWNISSIRLVRCFVRSRAKNVFITEKRRLDNQEVLVFYWVYRLIDFADTQSLSSLQLRNKNERDNQQQSLEGKRPFWLVKVIFTKELRSKLRRLIDELLAYGIKLGRGKVRT